MGQPVRLLAILGPGLLVAATGVGAGDLATATFSGSALGTAVLWAVVMGAALKYALNEGIARWQLATGTTVIDGIGSIAAWLFLPYLLLWSYFVGAAMMSACGVTMQAIWPAFDDAADGKLWFGVAHSAAGAALALAGGYRLFEKIMSIAIAVMFVTVLATAALLLPDVTWAAPGLPDAGGKGLGWTVALLGGVGGTVTVLCYGYWIREEGRTSPDDLRVCRIDLGVGYAMTALFGLAMVTIGSTMEIRGGGAGLIVALAEALEARVGPAGRWVFLLGAWGAVFSSLLGVWQSVPYLFCDVLRRARGRGEVATTAPLYRGYLLALATVPILGLLTSFREAQKIYAIVGAAFMPLLAVALLVLNRRRNGPLALVALGTTLAFFAWSAWRQWLGAG